MKFRYSSTVVGSAVAVLIGVVPASAQQQKASWFSNPFTISSGSENIPMPGGGSSMETVTLLTPSRFSIDGASARSHWGVGYQPEFEFRFGTGRMHSWNHSADASFGHLFSRRTRVDFGHSFVKSSDPARIFTDNIFVMPQNNFRENASAVSLSRETSARTTLNFRFDNTITKMSTVGDGGSTILNQYGVGGTAGISQRLGARHKLTFSYSLLKFSPYRFDTAVDAARFAANIPVVTAGIARYGQDLALSVSRSSPTPSGMVSGGKDPGSSPAPSSPAPSSTGATTTANVSVAGQDVGLTLPSTGLSTGGTATVSVSPAPAPAGALTATLPTVSATVSVPTVSVPTVSVPTVSVPTVSVPTVSVPIVPVVTAPQPAPVPIVVSPPVVPLVPVISVPTLDPTVPLVGVVTPLPTATSTPTTPCVLVNNICSVTTAVTTSPGVPSVPAVTSTITKLSVEPTATGSTTAAPAAATGSTTAAPAAAAAPAAPAVSATGTADPNGQTTSPQLLGDPFHVLSATYTFTKGPGLLFEISGGGMRDREMTYLLGMQVERRLDRIWFAGGYQRFLSFFGTLPFQGTPSAGVITLPNGVRARSVFSALTGRAGGKINRKTQLEMSVSFSKSSSNFVAQDVKSAIARARISYWFTDRVGVFADADSFYESGSEAATEAFRRQRYFGGLQVRFSPANAPAQRAGN